MKPWELIDAAREQHFLQDAATRLQSQGSHTMEGKNNAADLGLLADAAEPRCMDFVNLVEELRRRKPGDVVSELCANLRTEAPANSSHIETRALDAELLQRACDELQSQHEMELPHHSGLALFCGKLFTMLSSDIDRFLLCPEAADNVVYRPGRADGERSGKSFNTTLFREASSALRALWDWSSAGNLSGQPTRGAEAALQDESLSRWVKWVCALGSLVQPLDRPRMVSKCFAGLPRAVVKDLQEKRPGDLIFWPVIASATASTISEAAANSLDLAKPAARGGTAVVFTINSVLEGFDLSVVSQYPEEEELLLPLFTVLKVRSITTSTTAVGQAILRIDCRFCRSLVPQTFLTRWWQDLWRSSVKLRDDASGLREVGLSWWHLKAEEEHQRRRGEVERLEQELKAVKRMKEERQKHLNRSESSHQEFLKKSQQLQLEKQQLQLKREKLQRKLMERSGGSSGSRAETERIYEEEMRITVTLESMKVGEKARRAELREVEQRRREENGRSRSYVEEAEHLERQWASACWREHLALLRKETEALTLAQAAQARGQQARLEEALEVLDDLEEEAAAPSNPQEAEVMFLQTEHARRERAHLLRLAECRELLQEAERQALLDEQEMASQAKASLEISLQLRGLLLSSAEVQQELFLREDEVEDALEELGQALSQSAKYKAAEAALLPRKVVAALREACRGAPVSPRSLVAKSCDGATELRGSAASRLAIVAALQRVWEQKAGTVADELVANLKPPAHMGAASVARQISWEFLTVMAMELYSCRATSLVSRGPQQKPIAVLCMMLCAQREDVDRYLVKQHMLMDELGEESDGDISTVVESPCGSPTSILCAANRALRQWCESIANGEDATAARRAVEHWVKWLCAMNALAIPLAAPQVVAQPLTRLPPSILEALRCKRPGDEITLWGLASTTTDLELAEAIVSEVAPLENNALLRITGVTEAVELAAVSPYPEEELLLPLFARLRVVSCCYSVPPLELHCEYIGSLMSQDFQAQCLADLQLASKRLGAVLQEAQGQLRQKREMRNRRAAEEVRQMHELERTEAGCHEERMAKLEELVSKLEAERALQELARQELEAEAERQRALLAEKETERRRALETTAALRQRRELVRRKLHTSSWWGWDGKGGHLRVKSLDEAGVKDIAFILPDDESMTKLFLNDCEVADQGMEVLAGALKENRHLRVLSVRYAQVADTGAQALGEALTVNHSLELLNLQNNMIGDEGMRGLAEALKSNSSLKELWLSDNCCTDEGAKILAEAVLLNLTSSLRRLDLSNNFISPRGKMKLLDSFALCGRTTKTEIICAL